MNRWSFSWEGERTQVCQKQIGLMATLEMSVWGWSQRIYHGLYGAAHKPSIQPIKTCGSLAGRWPFNALFCFFSFSFYSSSLSQDVWEVTCVSTLKQLWAHVFHLVRFSLQLEIIVSSGLLLLWIVFFFFFFILQWKKKKQPPDVNLMMTNSTEHDLSDHLKSRDLQTIKCWQI